VKKNRTRTTGFVVLIASAIGCNYAQEFQLLSNGDAGPPVDGGCGAPSDPNNCGACGHSCLGGDCANGSCVPVVLASGQGDSVSGVPWYPYTTDGGDPLVGPDRLAVDDSYVFWLNLRGEVMRVPVAGGDAVRVTKTKGTPGWIDLDDTFVYFSTLGGEIFRVPKAGGNPVLLVPASPSRRGIFLLPGSPYPMEFKLFSGQLRWSDGGGIYGCPTAGCSGAPEILESGTAGARPFSFAIDSGGKMYASEEDHQSTGPGTETVSYAMTVYRENQWLGLTGPTAYYELQGGAHEVYALATTDFGPTGVVRWTESAVTFLSSGDALPGAPRGLAIDDGFAYWSNAAVNDVDRSKRRASVVRCAKTGCAAPEVLAKAQLVPRAVALSKVAIFWTTGEGNVLKLAKPGDPSALPLR
jgi:hypothetical protein